MNWYNVKVNWLSLEEGGRKNLPTGKRYMTVSRFQESNDEWLAEAWSVVLMFDEPPSLQGYTCFGKARFLVDKAPFEKFKTGNRFDLYEGAKKVAEVAILKPIYASETKNIEFVNQ